MTDSDGPIWDRTLRRIRSIWPLGEAAVLKERVAAGLPDGDLPQLRKKIDACLQGRGGEVSARTRAAELGETYLVLNSTGRRRFLELLAVDYDVDNEQVEAAIASRRAAEEPEEVQRATIFLRNLLDPPRAKLLRQFNELEEGVKFLVDLRAELISWAKEDLRLKALDLDVFRLLSSWFDVGFLDLQQITWKTPAAVLEKLIEYEAVHEISSWQDLKNRLAEDRRCYAFFHPRMPEEPLIFVEVALVSGMSTNIHDLLDVKAPSGDPEKADTAIFYSISTCQEGLAGVSFGNFLIKRVVADLAAKLPNVRKFSTLSPIPGFIGWIRRQNELGELWNSEAVIVNALADDGLDLLTLRKILEAKASFVERSVRASLQSTLLKLCARYLVQARREDQAYDRVAHFHLTNGARIHRINWAADLSDKGLSQSAGMMVNYLYDLPHIEKNHEAYRSNGEIAVSSTVRKLMK
jgi:malonyl-CoA decarboxylase